MVPCLCCVEQATEAAFGTRVRRQDVAPPSQVGSDTLISPSTPICLHPYSHSKGSENTKAFPLAITLFLHSRSSSSPCEPPPPPPPAHKPPGGAARVSCWAPSQHRPPSRSHRPRCRRSCRWRSWRSPRRRHSHPGRLCHPEPLRLCQRWPRWARGQMGARRGLRRQGAQRWSRRPPGQAVWRGVLGKSSRGEKGEEEKEEGRQ